MEGSGPSVVSRMDGCVVNGRQWTVNRYASGDNIFSS